MGRNRRDQVVNIAIFFLSISLASSSEVTDQLDFLREVNPIISEETDERFVSLLEFKETSEIKLAFSGVIRFYQIYISSQDAPSCNFTLTCSRFMTKAIQKYGAIHGFLMASDRLHRCFGASRIYYPRDPKTGLAIDYPVEVYYIGRSKSKFSLPEKLCSHKGTRCVLHE
jgi:putative component of membrane protein insertase Oxa1/YidC/SpoIIIJ protein YidD